MVRPSLFEFLLTEYLPEADDVSSERESEVDLETVVVEVKKSRMLTEDYPEVGCSRMVECWGDYVAAWCEHVISLVTCAKGRRTFIGVHLLGFTIEECSNYRFSISYGVWLQARLSTLFPPSEFSPIRKSACAAIMLLLKRLARASNLARDGILHAKTVVLPLLQLLNEDDSDSVLDTAVSLLCSIMNHFPEAINPNYERIENVIMLKIVSGEIGSKMSQMYAQCLALLPKTKGDEESWLMTMELILNSIDTHLSEVFLGFEEGKNPSVPVEDWIISGEGIRFKQVLSTVIPSLMFSCNSMIRNPYPVEVNVHIEELLRVIGRALMVKPSSFQDESSFMLTMQQEIMCSELPVLHIHCLDLLHTTITAARSQIIPFDANIIHIVEDYLGNCRLPAIRTHIYSVIRSLFMSASVGAPVQLTEEVISNAIADLDFTDLRNGTVSSSTGAMQLPSYRKRKHDSANGSFEGLQDAESMEVRSVDYSTICALKIAALEAIEALLSTGKAQISDHQRSNINHLLMEVTTNAFDVKRASNETGSVPLNESTWSDLLLAALRALMISILSQSPVDRVHLSQGVALFHKGKCETERISAYCISVLSILEALINPRPKEILLEPSRASRQTSDDKGKEQ